MRHGRANLHAFDPARIGFQNLEFDATRMAQQFAAHRHAPEHREDETAQSVGLLIALFRQKVDIEQLLELFEVGAGACSEGAVAIADDQFLVRIMLIRNVADDLFDQQIVQLKINKMNMLTEALRSFVMRIAWEHDHKVHSANAGLAMNFSTDVIQEVTELNLEIHGSAGGAGAGAAEKLVRDGFIWSHLAGDSVQRLKVAGRLAQTAAH